MEIHKFDGKRYVELAEIVQFLSEKGFSDIYEIFGEDMKAEKVGIEFYLANLMREKYREKFVVCAAGKYVKNVFASGSAYEFTENEEEAFLFDGHESAWRNAIYLNATGKKAFVKNALVCKLHTSEAGKIISGIKESCFT